MTPWPRVRLDACCEIVSGATPKTGVAEFWGGNIRWATPADLSRLDSKWIDETPRKITEKGLQSCAATVLPAGSVLLSSRAPIGYVAINTLPMATNQGFKSLIPKTNMVDASYLYYWLRTHRRYLENLGNGATFKEISKAVISKVEIPLPPLREQRRIAEVLDQADGLQMKRQQAITLIDDLTRSIFLDMFGSPPVDQTLTTVGKLAAEERTAIRTGPFGSQLLHSEFVPTGIPVLGIDNVVENEFRWSGRRFITEEKYQQLARYRVLPGDVLITIMGTCGRCAIVPDDIPTAINTKHLCCITLNQDICLPEFLHDYFLIHPIARSYLQRTAKGAIMSGLNMGIIKELPVALPPMTEQREYVGIRRALQKQKEKNVQQVGEMAELCNSLQQRAFCGEL